MLKRATLYLGLLVAATLGVDLRPAVANVYYFDPGVLSPQFKSGTCIYRIFYGNYGSTPFASARFYSGDCGPVNVLGLAAGNNFTSYYDHITNGSGQDSCGSYFSQQATFVGPPAYGIGMVLGLRNNSVVHAFTFDGPDRVTPYRYC